MQEPSQVSEAPRPDAGPLRARASTALARGRDHLLSLQDKAGWWKGELQTNITMETEDLLLRRFLGILTDDVLIPTAAWIRSQQRADGSWANFHGGPGDLSTTVESYVALRLAGDATDADHMRTARQFILGQGGLERSRVFTRIWLALFGVWSWEELPALPPELIFFPSWFPFNVYDWACWARQTLVPITVIGAHRPRRDLGFAIDELRSGVPQPRSHSLSSWAGRFERLDQRAARLRAAPQSAAAPGGPASRSRVDRTPPRGRWIVGRHPAAVGLLDHRARLARLPAGSPCTAGCLEGAGGVHRTGRRHAAAGSLPVTRLGYGSGRDRTLGCRPAGRSSRPGQSGRLAARPGDSRPGRLGRAPPGSGAERLGL